MRSAILALLPAMALCAHAQQAVLRGVAVDAETGQPLVGAHIALSGSAKGAVSDAEGRFSLSIPQGALVNLSLSFTGFAELRRAVTAEDIATGEPLVLRMQRKAIELDSTEVRAHPAPEVVFRRADLHVGGYLVDHDGIWVLGYDKPQLWHAQAEAGARVMRVPRLVLLDTLFREVAGTVVPDDARAMHRDHGGRPVIEGGREGWVARHAAEGIVLERIDRRTLREAVLPWTDSLGGRLYGNNRSEQFPAYAHFARDLKTGKDELLCTVEDEFMMELFRSQYKYMSGPEKVIAMDLEIETGIDREIIAGFMTGFHKDLYFKVPYAPLFVVHDTLCVFDHAKERIMRYGTDGTLIAEVRMHHAHERHWSGQLLQDRRNGEVLALFRQGPRAWLRTVDARTGALGDPCRLTHPFAEEVQVHGGHAYYVYRPFGSMEKRTLFREALR
jgi:hypothetical protein